MQVDMDPRTKVLDDNIFATNDFKIEEGIINSLRRNFKGKGGGKGC